MLEVKDVYIRYDKEDIVKRCTFFLNRGEIMSIIGPNGSGKSTLLKAIAGFIPYRKGRIIFNSHPLRNIPKRELARQMCMLSQKNTVPNDMTVYELISYGRYPHKKWYERLNKDDHALIEWTMDKTNITHFADRPLLALSGGETQRVWIAMALAQKPQLLLLDEPTTYLDIAHQHEVLELIQQLNKEMNMTVIMVLHDLNQAARYSDRIFVMKQGEQKMCGAVNDVITEKMIRDVYRVNSEVEHVSYERHPRIHFLCSCKENNDHNRPAVICQEQND